MTKKQVIEKIFQALQRQKFADWYNDGGDFDQWISGAVDKPTDDEIKADIAKLFGLTD